MPDPRLNALGIVVADMNAARMFYGRLGLTFEVDERTPTHAACDLPNGLHLMLDTEEFLRDYTPDWQRGRGSPPVFLAFQFDTPDEVDAKHAELVAAGYASLREPWDAFWGMRYATVLDPDGNGVDLYAVRE
ncbi:VOC family protein [Streptomyces sp. NPDC006368]|uniref:VOC family protein n=1 Tax=Streptomyces sp. NPDC006368 TaxID=3156760 RepID=UPI0033B0C78A